MKQRVLVTRKLPQTGIEELEKYLDVHVNPADTPMNKDDIMHAIQGTHGLVCLLTDRIDADIIEAGQDLRIIANYAVGYDNIDVDAAVQKNIYVTNTPGVLTEATADLTWALLFAVSRRIIEADAYVRNGRFTGWEPMLLLGDDIHGKTLGIIGLGRIGQAVARRAHGYAMQVLYHEPERLPDAIEEQYHVQYQPLHALLERSDLVTLHVPLNEHTYHLIGEKELKTMQKHAYLINVSRGPVIDERALVQALQTGEIAGCGLDVYEREPAIEQELIHMPNTVLLPHIGSASRAAREAMAMIVARNVIAALIHNVRPPDLIDPHQYP